MAAVAGLCCVGALLAIAVLAVFSGRWRGAASAIYAACLALSLAGLLFALLHLLSGAPPADVTLPLGLPWVGAHFHVDALAAFFLVVANLGGASASLYAIGYGRHEPEPLRVLPFFPAFLAGMNLVVLAADAFSFLVAWEFMSLASWALVMAHHKQPGTLEAGYVYIVMASAGTLALLLAFGLLAGPEGGYAFAAIRAHGMSHFRAALVLGLALFGAGSKAGLVPLHVWLPLAHPAAPSHVSALMSGVMTKIAIYGFLRIVFDFLGQEAEWWWGIPILAAGGGTAVLGILYALMQDDLKRGLAYSTIENIGVIFAGLGLALAFDTNGWSAAGALALTAALFHVLNHALFKSLLFFGAGAVLTATGERQMDRLGGLIHRLPVTSFAVLVACAAASALPPLNGFVSEWLLFQAILLSPSLPHWGLKLLIPATGALLALAAALAAACFVRIFGIVFLGRPRSASAERATEVDRWSQGAMLALATLCVLAGILPGFVIDTMAPVVQSLAGARMPAQASQQWLSIVPVAESRSSYNGLVVFCFIAVSASLAAYVIHRFASQAVRRAPAWDCGFPQQSPATQYTAGSFSQPIRRIFGTYVFRAKEHVEMRPPGDLHPARFEVELHDLAWELIFTPISNAVLLIATRLNRLQYLTIRIYLSFVCFALVFLLLVLALWPDVILDLATQGAQMLLVLLLAPLLTGLIRKLKSRLLRRRGPAFLQPYHDLVRLIRKEAVLAENASWLFRATPYLVFASIWVATALVPTFATGLMFSWAADLIVVIALLGSARFFLALAGMDVGTSFGGIGSSREMMIATLAEPAMIMIVFSLALLAGSTQLSNLAGFMLSPAVGLRVTAGLALIALMMVAIAENGRIPIDNPATHLELTMVHEAMLLEYSGRHLAVIELAAWLKLLLYMSLIGCVFVPWGLAPPGASIGEQLTGVAAYVAKLATGGFLLAVFETAIAKMRIFRISEFLGAALMLGLLGVLLLFVTRTLR